MAYMFRAGDPPVQKFGGPRPVTPRENCSTPHSLLGVCCGSPAVDPINGAGLNAVVGYRLGVSHSASIQMAES